MRAKMRYFLIYLPQFAVLSCPVDASGNEY